MEGTWREQHERMRRWHSRLPEGDGVDDRRLDDYYAFFVVCFHLKDWLKNDSSLDASIRPAVEQLIERDRWLGMCADIANGFKHLRINKKVRVDAKSRVASEEPSFQGDLVQEDAFQVGRIVVVAAGSVWLAQEVADRCVAAWEAFLEGKGLSIGT